MAVPAVAGDAATVRAHLRELEDADSGVREAYLVLARVTLDRALSAGLLTAAAAEPIAELLAQAGDREGARTAAARALTLRREAGGQEEPLLVALAALAETEDR